LLPSGFRVLLLNQKQPMIRFFSAALLSALSYVTVAQVTVSAETYWEEITGNTNSFIGVQHIKARKYKKLSIDEIGLKEALVGVKHRNDLSNGDEVIISLLNPDGRITKFRVQQNSTMHPGLCEKFPAIRTYDLIGLDDLTQIGKMDITPLGFHAMVMSNKSTFFIDPMYHGETEVYISYYRSDFFTDKVMDCNVHSENETKEELYSGKTFGSCELRTYRLAVAATGEYTAFQGGTVVLAEAAQVTTMNRVNGLYERDMAITMEIVAGNDQIVYTNSGSDPYTNGSPGLMIMENQNNVDNVIGGGNYDIGHVFGTNSGGLAGLGVVCSGNSKARGVTGSSAPVGDPFDIDYVAHEMGHQLDANHTFNNSCNGNRNNSTAMEPGSGSTIMAYAGICSPDVQSNSDDHFHGISLEEIGDFITAGNHNCPVITQVSNVAPVIASTNGNVSVPANTPFILTCSASDADGDQLTYCWEQMDNQISTQSPVSTSTGGPNFRSNSPDLSPSRHFPDLNSVSSGSPNTWEVLSSVSRTMNFRVFVRDNSVTGGCNDHADITVSVDGNSGPFVVDYPSASGISWTGNTSETILWDVANTDASPVNCSIVDILLSTNAGATFPTVLASNVANDGAETITVPNITASGCRVRVIADNGTFYDISDKNFLITLSTVGVVEETESDFKCYPNPASGNVIIEFENPSRYKQLIVLDYLGREVIAQQLNSDHKIGFDLSNYSNGVYIFKLIGDDIVKFVKVIKK